MDEEIRNLLTNIAQILDVVKAEWGEAWSAWDQQQRDAITKFLDPARCTGCNTHLSVCRQYWSQQCKCCPDCSHARNVGSPASGGTVDGS
jgi:hypothetical protein